MTASGAQVTPLPDFAAAQDRADGQQQDETAKLHEGMDYCREDGRHTWAKQRHHLYLEKRIEHVHTTQSASADRFAALCLCLGFGGLHGGHWLFLAAKARVARVKTHLGSPAQPRVAQAVPLAAGQEIAVFVEPPPPSVGCALCGKAVAHDPCGIDFSFGPQEVPCKHAFCRHCLEAELAVSWGCPTCGDNTVWKFETRWKGPCVFPLLFPNGFLNRPTVS